MGLKLWMQTVRNLSLIHILEETAIDPHKPAAFEYTSAITAVRTTPHWAGRPNVRNMALPARSCPASRETLQEILAAV